ncbi:MAG: hypothetical protein M3O87_05245 [Candidatus Dormibacteraeota bacterium]|nr:hypothetical protein [Candidatus Dormibacteraeota bacterium]
MNEADEAELDALMRQRRLTDSRLNRALGELLGSGRGVPEVLDAIDEAEQVLRKIATLVSRIST